MKDENKDFLYAHGILKLLFFACIFGSTHDLVFLDRDRVFSIVIFVPVAFVQKIKLYDLKKIHSIRI